LRGIGSGLIIVLATCTVRIRRNLNCGGRDFWTHLELCVVVSRVLNVILHVDVHAGPAVGGRQVGVLRTDEPHQRGCPVREGGGQQPLDVMNGMCDPQWWFI